jgi:hypothetical protein
MARNTEMLPYEFRTMVVSYKILMSDSGISDIGLNSFIIGLIQYRTESIQSENFFSHIGVVNIDVVEAA